MLLIQSKQRFPAEARVSLVWGKGVMSRTGVATDQDQVLPFKTRKDFSAEFHCKRENVRAGCIPISPMSLRFSAPVSREQVDKIVLKGPGGKIWKPQFKTEKEPQFLREVSFPGPFPEDTKFSVELPPGLQDDAGRSLVNADKFPLSVRTDKYPPLAKFSSRFGILELKADPILPVTLRNLEPQVNARMIKVGEEGDLWKGDGKNLQPRRRKRVTMSRGG